MKGKPSSLSEFPFYSQHICHHCRCLASDDFDISEPRQQDFLPCENVRRSGGSLLGIDDNIIFDVQGIVYRGKHKCK